MHIAKLNVSIRNNDTGKSNSKYLRENGLFPAVIYGGNSANKHIEVDERQFNREIPSSFFNTRVTVLSDDKKSCDVMVKDISFHPVTDKILHVDFVRLEKSKKIVCLVPVKFNNANQSPGIKRGGFLNIIKHTVAVECSQTDIPENVFIDLAGVENKQVILSHSLILPKVENATILYSGPVASVIGKSVSTTATADEEKETG